MRWFLAFAFVVAGAFVVASDAHAQQPIEAVSVDSDGGSNGTIDNGVFNPMSKDGRWVTFSTSSDRVVAGDTNGTLDVFVRDRATGTTVRVSVAADGTQGNGASFEPAISGDGRFVAFASAANNLTADPVSNVLNVFLHDRDPDGNGIFDEDGATTILVSKPWNGGVSTDPATRPVISGDGSTLVFVCGTELTEDSDGLIEVFAFDIPTGVLSCVSVPGGGDCNGPSVSDDGSQVAFESYSTQLVAGDTNGDKDVFVRNRLLGVTRRVSVASDESQANDESFDASISADGTKVVFVSDATNLVPGDVNGRRDVFLRDRTSGTTTRVTQLADGTGADGDSFRPVVSADGSFVAFQTLSRNLVPLDTNQYFDILLADRVAGTFETISADCVGFTGSGGQSTQPAMTPDGRFVTFASDATNLTDDGFPNDTVYLRDRNVSWPMASATTYGDGWPGTLGIPALTSN